MTGLDEKGVGSLFMTGYASTELKGELLAECSSSSIDRDADGWIVITILDKRRKNEHLIN